MPLLPLSVDLRERETATSYTARLASRNGVSAADLCQDFDVTFSQVVNGNPEALAVIADLGGVSASDLAAWSPIYRGNRRHDFRGHIFHSKTIRRPEFHGCPLCLREDAEESDLPPEQAMAMQGHWLIPHVGVCLIHEHPLVPLYRESHPSWRYDSARQLTPIIPAILGKQFDRNRDLTSSFDDWIDERLVEGRGNDYLSKNPLHAASNFCRLLGIALLRLEGLTLSHIAAESSHGLYAAGFEVACEGEEAIQKALNRLERLVESPQDGPKKVYPALYDRLAHDYERDPDYAAFRQLLRKHMAETWPLGPGDELLGEPVVERYLHSVATASKATGLDPRRLRKLLIAEGLLASDSTARPDPWEIFDAKSAAPVLASMEAMVPATIFQELIGASRSQFDNLVADGVLFPASDAHNTNAVWGPRDGEAFLARLMAGAVQLRQPQHSWEHIAKSAQRLKIGPGVIVRAIWEGKLRRVGNLEGRTGYAAVFVDHDEVSRLLGAEAPPGYSIETFAKTIGLQQPSALRRLIEDGHTPATRLTNPRTRAAQDYLTQEDADAFYGRFYTLRTLSRAYRRTWQSLAAELTSHSVEPFTDQGRTYGRLFQKDHVEGILGPSKDGKQ
ncbi:TniQ family protein [Palleronia sp.]|uniref:TniQ family protein n=1 Tax=Palleronia sp. TaxID=1940284 RepID=UPI0035C7F4C6